MVVGATNDMVDGSQHWLCAFDPRAVRHASRATRGEDAHRKACGCLLMASSPSWFRAPLHPDEF